MAASPEISPAAPSGRAMSRWPRARAWLFVAVVFGLTFAAYLPVWHAGFIWDDDSHLTKNPCIVGPLGFAGIWTTAEGYYFPLVTATLWVVHALCGLNPLPYHLLNVLLHAIDGVLLWRVLRALNVPGAWIGALLWTLHPVQVESVAWISELKNTQSTLFYLLAIWFYVRWWKGCEKEGAGWGHPAHIVPASEGKRGDVRHTREPRRTWHWHSLAMVCGMAAMLSKSSTVMLPVVLVLCSGWLALGKARAPSSASDGERRSTGSGQESRRPRFRPWRDLVAVAPLVVFATLAAAWTIWEQRFHSAALGAEWNQTAVQRLLLAGRDFWFYLGKLAWPHPLIFIYPRWELDVARVGSYGPIAAAMALFVGLWLRRGATRPVLFAMAYFAVSLFPVLGFFNVYFFRYAFVGDHFQYLASMGPLALAGAAIAVGGRRWMATRREPRPAVAAIASAQGEVTTVVAARDATSTVAVTAVVAVVSLAFVAVDWRQTQTYRDNETLFRSVVQRNPSSAMAYNNLALEVAKSPERAEEAIADFRAGLRLNPDSAEIHYNLANLLRKRPGGITAAIEHYEAALRLQPQYAEAHNNLALALEQVPGRLNDAIAQYEAALRDQPENAHAHNNLAVVLATIPGRAGEALAHYEAALKIDPDYATAHKNLADLLALAAGRAAEAKAHYERALALAPDYPEAHFGLANLLAGEPGREVEAQRHYLEALRLRPDYAEAHNNLGILLARRGQFADAAQHWRRALELAPDYADPRRNLELLQRQRDSGGR